jgi:hypothetical protein
MLSFEGGYQLLATLLKTKGSLIEQAYGQGILTYIDHNYCRQKGNKYLKKSIRYVSSILEYYCGTKNYCENALRLKKEIMRQENQME